MGTAPRKIMIRVNVKKQESRLLGFSAGGTSIGNAREAEESVDGGTDFF